MEPQSHRINQKNSSKFENYSLKRGNGINESQHFRQLIETQMDTLKEDLGISVLHSYFIHGEYDLLTVFTAKDIMTAKKFITALLDKFPVTKKIRINQVLYTLREQYILTPNPEEV